MTLESPAINSHAIERIDYKNVLQLKFRNVKVRIVMCS